MSDDEQGQEDPFVKAAKARDAQAAAPDDPFAAAAHARDAQKANGPGVVSRAASMIGNAVMHPIDTIENAIASPVKSAVTALSPGVGEARPDLRLSKGGNSSGAPIDTTPYDSAHGGVTPKERAIGAAQTVANIATPGAFSAVKSAAAPIAGPTVARLAALTTTGAGQGAVQNPDDPAAGALAGAVTTPVAGEAARAITKPLNTIAVARRAMATPDAGEVLPDLTKERSTVAGPLYDQFRSLGDLGRTPDLDALLGDGSASNPGLPIIRRAIETVKGESPSLNKLPDTDARVLDAAVKRVGNKAFTMAHGYEAGEAKTAFQQAIDDAAQAHGGSYLDPVSAYREGSENIDATQRGRDVMANALSTAGGSKENATINSPKAFADWIKTASPEERNAALQGVYGDVGRRGVVKMQPIFGTRVLPTPSPALAKGVGILNRVGETPFPTSSVDPLLSPLGMFAPPRPTQSPFQPAVNDLYPPSGPRP